MLTFGAALASAGLDPTDLILIRHAYIDLHDDGYRGISANSSDSEIFEYTRQQSVIPGRFPSLPPRHWAVFLPEGRDRARLWRVFINHGETDRDEHVRSYHLEQSSHLTDLNDRLVIGWRAPRSWHIKGTTSLSYPIVEIADARPVRFPGFDALTLDYPQLQAVMHEHRYAAWCTALASVTGIYLITDTGSGRHYVGKADGAENLLQRWRAYAANGHGGNIELKGLDPTGFRFSVLRVFDPATPSQVINDAESHFKHALDSRQHGLNRN